MRSYQPYNLYARLFFSFKFIVAFLDHLIIIIIFHSSDTLGFNLSKLLVMTTMSQLQFFTSDHHFQTESRVVIFVDPDQSIPFTFPRTYEEVYNYMVNTDDHHALHKT